MVMEEREREREVVGVMNQCLDCLHGQLLDRDTST